MFSVVKVSQGKQQFLIYNFSLLKKDGSEPGPDPSKVDSLLRQGDTLRAFRAALQNSPINTKNQAVKERAHGMVLKVLTNFKSIKIEQAVQSLDRNGTDLLMKYIYKRFEKPTENSTVLLQWHKKSMPLSTSNTELT
uniref:Actin-related protein 2/3 complex subunit 5 n=1 Tax=Suricata suricatta TaxID=37032 RepID=A0A673SYX4_SURSU